MSFAAKILPDSADEKLSALREAGLIAEVAKPKRSLYGVTVAGDWLPGVRFASKASANAWIESHGRRIEWRAGWVFRLHGISQDILVSKITNHK